MALVSLGMAANVLTFLTFAGRVVGRANAAIRLKDADRYMNQILEILESDKDLLPKDKLEIIAGQYDRLIKIQEEFSDSDRSFPGKHHPQVSLRADRFRRLAATAARSARKTSDAARRAQMKVGVASIHTAIREAGYEISYNLVEGNEWVNCTVDAESDIANQPFPTLAQARSASVSTEIIPLDEAQQHTFIELMERPRLSDHIQSGSVSEDIELTAPIS